MDKRYAVPILLIVVFNLLAEEICSNPDAIGLKPFKYVYQETLKIQNLDEKLGKEEANKRIEELYKKNPEIPTFDINSPPNIEYFTEVSTKSGKQEVLRFKMKNGAQIISEFFDGRVRSTRYTFPVGANESGDSRTISLIEQNILVVQDKNHLLRKESENRAVTYFFPNDKIRAHITKDFDFEVKIGDEILFHRGEDLKMDAKKTSKSFKFEDKVKLASIENVGTRGVPNFSYQGLRPYMLGQHWSFPPYEGNYELFVEGKKVGEIPSELFYKTREGTRQYPLFELKEHLLKLSKDKKLGSNAGFKLFVEKLKSQ